MLCSLIMIFVIAADQISKEIVISRLELGDNVGFIPHILSFARRENTGMAWGMLSEHRWVFITVSSVAIIAFCVFYFRLKKPHWLFSVATGFIVGGGIGNMIDRFFRVGSEGENAVVDFLKFEFIDFPVFNVADSFITVGVAVLLVYFFFFDKKQPAPIMFEAKKEAEEDGITNG